MIRSLLLPISFAILAKAVIAAPTSNQAASENAVLAREQRVALLRDEIKAIDGRMEERVDAIVAALRSIGDSKDSRSKVARMKRDTIDRLQRTIDYYRQKRAKLQEELRRPTLNLTTEQKQQVIAKFDARIEKRVAQIVSLQQSMPGQKDYDRYKATGSAWWGTTYEFNEDYRQNQRLASHTNSQRKEIAQGLQEAIARLEQQIRTLKTKGAPADEIAKTEALLSERRKQLGETLKPVATPTKMIAGKEAADLDQALKTEIADLQRDFNTLFSRYHAALQALSELNVARAQLAAVKAKP